MTAASSSWEDAVRWLREQPGKAELLREAYYDDPLPEAADRYWRSNEWQAVRRLIGDGPGRALDAGAGRGIASYALARDGYAVTALEPDPSDLVGAGAIRALMASEGLGIEIVEELSERLPFEDASFDVIFARAVLHHIGDLPGAMREFHRVLKPGGKLVAIREHVISREEDRPAFLAAHPLHHRYGGENALRLPVYVAAIEDAGLSIEKILGPLDSPINYGPQTLGAMMRRLLPLPILPGLAAWILGARFLGGFARNVLRRIDRRPGRHYSFLARRVR